MAKGGAGVLTVDGKEVSSKSIPHTVPAILTIDETFDVGSDTRTAVDDADYKVPFRFTGKIGKVQVKLGPSQLMPEDHKAVLDVKSKTNN
jgi:arylsulfatase